MNIFLLLAIKLTIIILLLRRKLQIGICMLVGGLFIWLIKSGNPVDLMTTLIKTFSQYRTYDIILALYFVMCLEIELRLSGSLTDMVKALRRIFSSVKVLLAAMPAFLGLLPSVGGARFSAPIVEELSEDLSLTPSHKAAINFWFRHLLFFLQQNKQCLLYFLLLLLCFQIHLEFCEYAKHKFFV